MDALIDDDLKFILSVQFPRFPADLINKIVQFNSKLASQIGIEWGHAGSPWEMNLRDITRWCQAIEATETVYNKLHSNDIYFNPGDSVELIYVHRMRTKEDRQKVIHLNTA